MANPIDLKRQINQQQQRHKIKVGFNPMKSASEGVYGACGKPSHHSDPRQYGKSGCLLYF